MEQQAQIDPNTMHDRSLFDPNANGEPAQRPGTSATGKDMVQLVKSQDNQTNRLPGVNDSFDSQGSRIGTGGGATSATGNPYSILKSSALWKKKQQSPIKVSTEPMDVAT